MSEPTTEQLSAYLDHELDDSAQRSVAEHVATCSNCQARLEGLRQTAYAVRALPMETPPRSFTIPEKRRAQGWRWAPVGWIGGVAVAMLIVVVGVSNLHFGGGGAATSSLSISSNGSAPQPNTQYAPAERDAGHGASAVAAPQNLKSAANQVTVVDPTNGGRQLSLAADRSVYSVSSTMSVQITAIGEPIAQLGRLQILFRRGSYGVELPWSSPASSSDASLTINSAYTLQSLNLPTPKEGKYVLTVIWTDSSGATLIAELPVSLTS